MMDENLLSITEFASALFLALPLLITDQGRKSEGKALDSNSTSNEHFIDYCTWREIRYFKPINVFRTFKTIFRLAYLGAKKSEVISSAGKEFPSYVFDFSAVMKNACTGTCNARSSRPLFS